MDSFEWNKIAGAVLLTLLVYLGVQNLAAALFATEPAAANAYIVENVATQNSQATTPQAAPADPPIATLLQTASITKGQKIAKKCVSCHVFESGGAHKIGPALWNIVGTPIAAANGFNYSAALSGLGGAWDIEALNGFLKNPKKYAQGTNMAFIGLRKAQDRADIIAYLRSLKN